MTLIDFLIGVLIIVGLVLAWAAADSLKDGDNRNGFVCLALWLGCWYMASTLPGHVF